MWLPTAGLATGGHKEAEAEGRLRTGGGRLQILDSWVAWQIELDHQHDPGRLAFVMRYAKIIEAGSGRRVQLTLYIFNILRRFIDTWYIGHISP